MIFVLKLGKWSMTALFAFNNHMHIISWYGQCQHTLVTPKVYCQIQRRHDCLHFFRPFSQVKHSNGSVGQRVLRNSYIQVWSDFLSTLARRHRSHIPRYACYDQSDSDQRMGFTVYLALRKLHPFDPDIWKFLYLSSEVSSRLK